MFNSKINVISDNRKVKGLKKRLNYKYTTKRAVSSIIR